jgi:glycosyltransferase involved in cell wall biosynthesis
MDELHELYDLSEFVVLPYTYSFSSSLALSFAMQHAKPVIVTDVGVFKEEIDNNVEGLLCTPSSSVSLEAAMDKLIRSDNLRHIFSLNMRKKAEQRAWSLIAKQNLQVYANKGQKTIKNSMTVEGAIKDPEKTMEDSKKQVKAVVPKDIRQFYRNST